MADGYDRFDNEAGGGGSFVMGLLTGTVLGAGLGMLFAPKAGSELRNQISEQAGNFANTASEQYRRVFGDYHAVAEEVLDQQHVPPGSRYYINRYFQLIRPRAVRKAGVR